MKSFEEFKLFAPVQLAIAEARYEIPTPIQVQAIPPAMLGRDVLGCAQTGTGKTAAFALPILNTLGRRSSRAVANRPRAIILAPTRELAVQIGECFARYGKRLHLRQALVYGGVSQVPQVKALKRGVHIVIATPGRLLDLMEQGHIDLGEIEVFVLDEVDRMLDMGFLPDLKRIISALPDRRQSLFFSATLPPRIIELSKRLLRDPVRINVTPKSPSVDKIDQRVVFVDSHRKLDLLHRVLKSPEVSSVLVFTRTKRRANTIAGKLVQQSIRAVAIHGNKSQNARQQAMNAFQQKRVDVLVATDVASRGIDVSGISHVINFDVPNEPEIYIHRIGRTGRAGNEGIALSLCSPAERGDLRAIEVLIGKTLTAFSEDKLLSASAGSIRSQGRQQGFSRRTPGATTSGTPRRAGGKPSGASAGAPPVRKKRRRWARRDKRRETSAV